jgi:tRNA pseudouridine38-40 synthase
MRVKLVIAYNGKNFLGLQSQSYTNNTILGTLQKCLATLGIHTKLVASGRTDKEVHATRQVIHFDLPHYWNDINKLERTLKHQLPQTIMIRNISFVSEDFHARYGAKRRVYRYILSSKKPNPFEVDFITFVENKLYHDRLQSAMNIFVGKHNFEYFKKNGSPTPH